MYKYIFLSLNDSSKSILILIMEDLFSLYKAQRDSDMTIPQAEQPAPPHVDSHFPLTHASNRSEHM